MPDAVIDLDALGVIPQPFETAVFGAPVWKLEPPGHPAALDVRDILAAARREGVALVSARIDEGDPLGAALLGAGFRRVERLVTLERALDGETHRPADLAGPDAAAACAAIGRAVFAHDRFHADPRVPDAIADEIKARWVENDVRGRADAPIVAREGGEIVGFNLCLRRGEVAVIDLIGVASAHRGRGLGRALVRAAIGHYAGRCRTMRVGTQAGNAASLALYESEGLAPVHVAETFHWTPDA